MTSIRYFSLRGTEDLLAVFSDPPAIPIPMWETPTTFSTHQTQNFSTVMSSSPPPPPGPSGGRFNQAKAKSPVPRNSRVRALAARQAGAKSGSSGSEDDQQAARPRTPLPSPSKEGASPSRGIASHAHLDTNVLTHPIAGLRIDRGGSTITMDQLPLWAKALSRKDPATGRAIAPRPRPLPPPPSSADADPAIPDTMQPTGVLLPDQEKYTIWYMTVTPAGSSPGPRPRRTILRKWNLPPLDPNTTAEEDRRIETLQYMRVLVRHFRSEGGPPYRYRGPYHPDDKRFIEHMLGWVLTADEVNRLIPDLATTTVWINPFRLDMLYMTLGLLFADLYILGIP